MTAFIAFLASRWQAALGIAAAVGVLMWGRHQRTTGRAERENEIRADANARQMEAVTDATDAASRVRDADPAERERLRAKWRKP
jgi:hypothetical protein